VAWAGGDQSARAARIYHYNGRDHSLERVLALERQAACQMATAFICGQSYFGSAHASFILTARFHRNHWKYRRHQKAYAGMLMDAAHLSQTLYLVSAARKAQPPGPGSLERPVDVREG
jgi:hypothetical protein